MRLKSSILFIASFVLLTFVKAQNKKADSLAITAVFKLVMTTCKETVPADPQIKTLGRFYKASSYVVYGGADKTRAWKDFVNYANKDEQYETNNICKRVNRTVNQDSGYKVVRYFTKKESEGLWHVLLIHYKVEGVEKDAAFAFLKIGNRFGLGDIDVDYK